MKKKLSFLLACVLLVSLLAACTVAPINTTPSSSTPSKTVEPSKSSTDTTTTTPSKSEPTKAPEPTAKPKEKPKKITVEIYDRGNAGDLNLKTTTTPIISKEVCSAIIMWK